MDGKHFSPDRLSFIATAERSHFWFVTRRELIQHVLARHLDRTAGLLLDLGCGTGYNLRAWSAFAARVVGLDRLALRGSDLPDQAASRIEGDICALPFAAELADVVIALDVLEHVCDRRALVEVARVLRPGGILVLTVPAMPWLWSHRDEAAGHLRRYTRKSLHKSVSEAGLSPVFSTCYQCILFPFVVLSRWLGRKNKSMRDYEDRPRMLINGLMTLVSRLEVLLFELKLRLPFGSSLVLVARKEMCSQQSFQTP